MKTIFDLKRLQDTPCSFCKTHLFFACTKCEVIIAPQQIAYVFEGDDVVFSHESCGGSVVYFCGCVAEPEEAKAEHRLDHDSCNCFKDTQRFDFSWHDAALWHEECVNHWVAEEYGQILPWDDVADIESLEAGDCVEGINEEMYGVYRLHKLNLRRVGADNA